MTILKYPDDFLRQHLYTNAWCAPQQDTQRVFSPERMTPNNGVLNKIKIGWKSYDLPGTGRYHVYNMGQIFPELIGWIGKQRTWFSMRYLCQELDAFCDVYVDKGILIPRHLCHYLITDDKQIIVAVNIPDNRLINIDLSQEDIFLRIYRNKYYKSSAANIAGYSIECDSRRSVSALDILGMQNYVDQLKQRVGGVICYVNGYIVNHISLLTATPGDYIEFIYDPSIKTQLTFPVSELHEYVSEVDSTNKYLVHNPVGTDKIDYYDDIDIHVINNTSTGVYKGVYFHKNTASRVRNITHRDYSVSSNGVSATYTSFNPPINHTDAYLHVIIREADTRRTIINEANRVRDLYRMDDDDVYSALIGFNSLVNVWNVSELEKSKFNNSIRKPFGELTRQDAFDALGYNAISKLIGDTPNRVYLNSGQRNVAVPLQMRKASTAYEYDSSGHLIGSYPHTNHEIYLPHNQNCDVVEFIFGLASTSFDDVIGQQTSTLDTELNHRFYICDKIGGVPDEVWRDVSGTSYYHVYPNGQVIWAVNSTIEQQLVRSNSRHLFYEFDSPMEDGNVQFNISQWDAIDNRWETLKIPPARIDIFLNGKSLIEDIDYIVHWPSVYITTKEYFINPGQTQRISIRATGFCKNDMQRIDAGDTGFVKHRVLSENNIYNLRDDRVNRIIVGGSLKMFDDLKFAETDGTVRVQDAYNGKPYCISDILVPMNIFSESSTLSTDPTLSAREQSRAIDAAISNYLTLKLPERVLSTPSTFVRKYVLFSPFFTKLFHAILNGGISGPWMTEHYAEQRVSQECAQYQHLLNWDPITEENEIDPTFVEIHPHPYDQAISLNAYQYKFMNIAVRLYGRGRINLSSHATIST